MSVKPCEGCSNLSPEVPDDGAHLAIHDCEVGEWWVITLTIPADFEPTDEEAVG